MRARWLIAGLWLTTSLARADRLALPRPLAPPTPASDGLRAVIHWRDGIETLVLEAGYRGPAGEVAWLVPVPTRPEPGACAILSPYRAGLLHSPAGLARQQELRASRRPWDLSGTGSLLLPSFQGTWVGLPSGGGAPREPAHAAPVREQPGGDAGQVLLLDVRHGAELTSWLAGQGLPVPAGLAATADGYLRRGWTFIALRQRTGGRRGAPVRQRLQPFAVRFPAARPVLPLALTRLTAPERTAVDLVVYAPWPATCGELEVLPAAALAGKGELLATRMRRLCARHGNRALLTAYAGPVPAADYVLGSPELAPLIGHDPGKLVLTRLWGLLDREALADLTLQPGPLVPEPEQPTERLSTQVDYRATFDDLLRTRLPVLVAWLLALALLGPLTRLRLAAVPDAEVTMGWRERWGLTWRFVLAWGVMLAATQGLWEGLWLIPDLHSLVAAPCAAIAAGTVLVLFGRMTYDAEDGAARGVLVAAGLLGCGCIGLVLLAQPTSGGVALGPSTAPPLWCAAVLLIARLDGSDRDPRRPAFAPAILGGLLAAMLVAGLLGLGRPAPANPEHEVAAAVFRELEPALDRFSGDTGGLPAKLADLAARRAPAAGRDSSGNLVRLDPASWRGPYLHRLPIDPTTGRRDTWRYEPSSDQMIEPGEWDRMLVVVP